VVYKRGEKEIAGVSYYAVFQARSVTCELNLEAGEYIIFPRYDRYKSNKSGYFEESIDEWDERKLTRVLTERAQSRSIALNLPEWADTKHFSTSIETLIEYDLEKLEAEKQPVVADDGDVNWQEEASDVDEEEENVEKNAEDDDEKVDGDANECIEGPPGSFDEDDEDKELKDHFDDEDLDPIILGVRIYAKGEIVVSLTGEVIGEGFRDDEYDENKDEDGLKKAMKKAIMEDAEDDSNDSENED